MATWPATLPPPLLAGYQGQSGANVIRTDMEAGEARQRLRYGEAPEELSMSWRFKAAEMAIFKAFWRDEISRGADYFAMDLDIGEGIAQYQVRFISGNYQYQRLPGSNWQVTARVDVLSV